MFVHIWYVFKQSSSSCLRSTCCLRSSSVRSTQLYTIHSNMIWNVSLYFCCTVTTLYNSPIITLGKQKLWYDKSRAKYIYPTALKLYYTVCFLLADNLCTVPLLVTLPQQEDTLNQLEDTLLLLVTEPLLEDTQREFLHCIPDFSVVSQVHTINQCPSVCVSVRPSVTLQRSRVRIPWPIFSVNFFYNNNNFSFSIFTREVWIGRSRVRSSVTQNMFSLLWNFIYLANCMVLWEIYLP